MTTGALATRRYIKSIQDCEPFSNSTGSLRGLRGVAARTHQRGWLNDEEWQRYLQSDVIYLVVSYSTPIGWVNRDGSVVYVKQTFTPTTRKHQACLDLWPCCTSVTLFGKHADDCWVK